MARPEIEPKTDIAKRLRAVRAAVGIEDRDAFAERMGISKSTIANYERGDRVPDAAMLEKYRDSWHVDLNWLITGEDGDMFLTPDFPLPEPVERFLDDHRKKHRRPVKWAEDHASATAIAERILNGQGFQRLPVYGGVQAAAGISSIPIDEQTDGVISFDPRFLRDQGGNPEKCVVIWAHGDSMMPTIPDGSALIVDRSQKEIKNGSIMVIGVDDDLLVKRIRRRSDGLIELISDNRTYEPETLGPAALQKLRVIGRVVYFCRTP